MLLKASRHVPIIKTRSKELMSKERKPVGITMSPRRRTKAVEQLKEGDSVRLFFQSQGILARTSVSRVDMASDTGLRIGSQNNPSKGVYKKETCQSTNASVSWVEPDDEVARKLAVKLRQIKQADERERRDEVNRLLNEVAG